MFTKDDGMQLMGSINANSTGNEYYNVQSMCPYSFKSVLSSPDDGFLHLQKKISEKPVIVTIGRAYPTNEPTTSVVHPVASNVRIAISSQEKRY